MESYPTWPNLASMMFDLARKWPHKPLFRAYRDNAWHGTNWAEFARMAASCARHLRAHGISPGDRVVICAENRPDYPIAEVALMAIRAVPVPTYATNTIADHAHILRDSGARAVIVKGGHMERAVDVVFDGNEMVQLGGDTVKIESTHGTGCTFASALTGHGLALIS